MANHSGIDLFLGSSCNVLLVLKSDHSPLLTTIDRSSYKTRKKQAIFIYEEAWELRNECIDFIRDAQREASSGVVGIPNIHKRILNYKKALQK